MGYWPYLENVYGLRLALVPWGYVSPTLAVLGCSKKFPNLEEKVLCGRCYKLDQKPSEPEKKIILAKPQYKADKRPHLSEAFLKGYEVREKTPALKKQNKGEIINIRYSLAQIIPGKNKPVQISLPMQKEPFDVQDDANEVIDKILERVIFIVVNGTNLQDDNFVDVDVIKLGGKSIVKDVKKNDLTLQLRLHEDVPIISDEELNTSGRMD
ncbi:hypothetical protein BU17DRAFT_72413 [Hysterangium stoloniferum]|nr:hypothetical protein BU17DRAFT_72413 [Hysterangium stoloniferum]